MDESPSSDVYLWKEYEELEWKRYSKADYYMAQIAWVTAMAGGASNVQLDDFLIDFEEEGESSSMSSYEKMQHSMSFWSSMTGKKITKG